ncbi:MAG: trigger factor, partial [Lachnospiraceae bacterium]|nr:trigger factor [Lachnospiraceae bacterium]
VDEYKADVESKIKERKESEAKSKKEDAVVEKIVENSQMDIPDAMLETQVRQMADDFAMRIQQQGLSLEQYFKFTGLTPEAMKQQMEPTAMKRIQTRLVLEAIVDAEKIEVSEEEMNAEFEKMAKLYQMEVEKLNELMGDFEKENMKKDLAVQKAVDLVVEAAVEV